MDCQSFSLLSSISHALMLQETLQWNGTTSKKKGQKWGRERTLSRKNEDNSCIGPSNEKTVAEEGKHVDGHIDFESLYPLTRLPEVCFHRILLVVRVFEGPR